jgi:hypothetical protein
MRKSIKRRRPADDADKRPDPDAFAIRQFCQNYGFSVAHYYRLRELGQAPVEMKVGGRILISKASAARWVREREADSVKSKRGGARR